MCLKPHDFIICRVKTLSAYKDLYVVPLFFATFFGKINKLRIGVNTQLELLKILHLIFCMSMTMHEFLSTYFKLLIIKSARQGKLKMVKVVF